MHPESHRLISQILEPSGTAPQRSVEASFPMSFEQIVAPRGGYSGPERRAQGALVAEITGPVPQTPIV